MSLKAGHRSNLRSCVFSFWHRASVDVRLSVIFTRRRKVDLCVSTSSRTMLAFDQKPSVARVAHVLLLRLVAGNAEINMLASKRSELIGNAAIVRKRSVIHKKSTCVCLRLPVAAKNAETQGRPVAGFRDDLNDARKVIVPKFTGTLFHNFHKYHKEMDRK